MSSIRETAEKIAQKHINNEAEYPYRDLVTDIEQALNNVLTQCVTELNKMRVEHEASGTHPQGLGVFRQAARRLQDMARL